MKIISKQFTKLLDNPKFKLGKSDTALNAMGLNENYSDPVIKLSIEFFYKGNNYLLSQKLFLTSIEEVALINSFPQNVIAFKFMNFIEFSKLENPLILVKDFGNNLGIDKNWSNVLEFLSDFENEDYFLMYIPRLIEELHLQEQSSELNHLVNN